jgi:hypothetical protein
MFAECRLLHEEINSFNRIEEKERWVIFGAKVVWIDITIV